MLGYVREGVIHSDYRDYAVLLPDERARELLLQFYARYEDARAAALEELRRNWVPPAVDDAAWEEHLRWLALAGLRSRDWLFLHEKRLSPSKRYQLICARRSRFLDAHPEYLAAVRRKVEEADGTNCGS